jgi:polysaccharide deacetylase family protein (PEP-CTERM system associated)
LHWHHFTVDVEDYFQVSAFEGLVPRSSWESYERRVGIGTRAITRLLGERGVQGTFFVLGWIAQREPDLVRELDAGGHEIASHGWDHRRVTRQSRDEFRRSIRSSKSLLEDLTGKPVRGFRAPSFSIVPGLEWALDLLIEEGYEYDSSLMPLARRGYGYQGASPDPRVIQRPAGSLLEVPPTVLQWSGRSISAAGGAYFRCLPYAVVSRALRAAEERGVPGTFYIHPWELDVAQPRLAAPFLTRIRHYSGLGRTTGRIHNLLRDFKFKPISATAVANRTGEAVPTHG